MIQRPQLEMHAVKLDRTHRKVYVWCVVSVPLDRKMAHLVLAWSKKDHQNGYLGTEEIQFVWKALESDIAQSKLELDHAIEVPRVR